MNPLSISSVAAETLIWARARLDILIGLIIALNVFPVVVFNYFSAPMIKNAFDLNYAFKLALITAITAIITKALIFARMLVDYNDVQFRRTSPWAIAFNKLLPMALLTFVINIASALGFLALIIPGIYIAIICVAATPALMAENLTIRAALDRSVDLTKNYRMHILGLGIFAVTVIFTSTFLWELIALSLIDSNAQKPPLWYFIFGQTVSASFSVLIICAQMIVYRRLTILHNT